ncbi:hypothetical protein LTR53_011837 [Teratosphaeriaceae sp. CCFEE 6253]|nr:hypothetical protein LTR53_011837 [Teratosphaeriaceae sp. CCFEE 6253]
MAALFGSRFHSIFNRRYWSALPFIRWIPYFLYFFGIAFDLAAALSISGTFDLTREKDCRGAMYVCLVFYVGTKTCIQLFLIERVHAIRAKLKTRLQDWLWLCSMFVLVAGFGTIAILAFIAPVGVVSPVDGQCTIGLPRTSLMVLMTYDIIVNIALTGTFIVLLVPLLHLRPLGRRTQALLRSTSSQTLRPNVIRLEPSKLSILSTTTDETALLGPPPLIIIDPKTRHLRMLVGKSTFGAVVMLTATIVNLMVLYRYNGMEHSWICFAGCLLDVTWSVTVIHLLTEGGKHNERPALIHSRHSNELRGARYQMQSLAARQRSYSSL